MRAPLKMVPEMEDQMTNLVRQESENLQYISTTFILCTCKPILINS